MKPFLEKIAERLLLKFSENMSSVALVLPTKRSVVFLKKYISLKTNLPLFLPKFFSIEEFIEEVSEMKVLDNISLQFYLYDAYLKSSNSKKDSFSEFLNWSNTLLKDYNDIDSSMIDPQILYNNLKDVKQLENWKLDQWSLSDESLSMNQKSFISFFESLYPIYLKLTDKLINNGFAYQGLANKIAAEKINTTKFVWDKIWFVGLNALTTSEHKIIDVLKEKDIARVFWDADKYYFNNNYHEASFFLKKQQKKWKEFDFIGVGDYLSKPKENIQIISCPNSISQTNVMRQVLSDLEKVNDSSKTAIILANEDLLYPALNNIPPEVTKLNVTMGSPFQSTPFFSFIDTLINLQINSKNNVFYYFDLFRILDHPYLFKIIKSKNIYSLKDYILDNNLSFISSEIILSEIGKSFNEIFDNWSSTADLIIGLDTVINLMRKDLIDKNATLDSEILNVFYKILRKFEVLINDFNFNIDLKSAYSIFKQLVAKEIIPFKGEPLEGVQLMGILESRTLDFNNVIILGVNEGFLPQGKSVNSFIPFDLKIYYKMPTYNERDAVFSYHFYRLLQRAKNITLTYNTQNDDFGSGEKSRFITQLVNEYKSNPISLLEYRNSDFQNNEIVSYIIKNSNLEKELKDWLVNGVSASAISKYINCNLDFYFHYLQKIREEKKINEFADNSLMGDAIHEALKKYPAGNIDLNNFKCISNKVKESIDIYYKNKLPNENYNKGKNLLSLSLAKKLINDFLEMELSKLKNNNIINILFKEEKFEFSLQVENIDCNLKGTIDRVDIFENKLRIIDYKTGRAVKKKDLCFVSWQDLFENRDKKFLLQIFMYVFLFLKKYPKYIGMEILAGIYSLRNLEEGIILVNSKEDILFNNNFLNNFEKNLVIFLNKVINEDFSSSTNKDNCKYCDHKSIL